jgi:hypothetical protein
MARADEVVNDIDSENIRELPVLDAAVYVVPTACQLRRGW